MSGSTSSASPSATSSGASRLATAVEMRVRESVRTPVLVGLLVFLPAYMVGAMGFVTPDTRIPIEVAGETLRVPANEVYAVLMVVMAPALVGGIAGLYLVEDRDADSRLVLAGYRSWELALARFAVLGVVGTVASVASIAVLSVTATPESVLWVAVGGVAAAVVYGLFGALVGTVLDRLPGVYLLLFGPSLDVFLYQNPMLPERASWAVFLPGHGPTALVVDAAFGSGIDADPLWWLLGAVIVLGVAAGAALGRSFGSE